MITFWTKNWGTSAGNSYYRIYGNYDLLEEINRVLAAACGVPQMKLQKTSHVITKAVYYAGKTCGTVLAWLYRGAELFNLLRKASGACHVVGCTHCPNE